MDEREIQPIRSKLKGGLRYAYTKPLQVANTIPLFSPNPNCLYNRRMSLTCRTKGLCYNQKLNRVTSPPPKEPDPLDGVIIEINDNPDRKESAKVVVKRRSKWALVRCVLRAITLFQTNVTETINNEEDFNKALENIKSSRRSFKERHREYEKHFREERFYDLIARGDITDIKEIEDILHKTRKPYEDLINRPNRLGKTPLYIATQDGNLAMVKYLISKKANPLIVSRVSELKTESNLLVAARWKHAKIVEFYLNFYVWPFEELKKAKKEAGNSQVREILASHIKSNKPKNCFLWCCLSK